jgi:hypothetical protein
MAASQGMSLFGGTWWCQRQRKLLGQLGHAHLSLMAITLKLTPVDLYMLAHQAELLSVQAGPASVRTVPLLHLGMLPCRLSQRQFFTSTLPRSESQKEGGSSQIAGGQPLVGCLLCAQQRGHTV